MNKIKFLEEIKSDLLSIVSNLTFDNLEETNAYLKNYLCILNSLNDLPNNLSKYNTYEQPTTITPNNTLTEIYDANNNIFLGQTHLNLSGANIGSFKIFIPEKFIRKLNIEEGDWVKASVIRKAYNQKPVYEYELIEKVAAESNKKVIKYAIVEFDEDLEQYYIDSSEDRLSTKILLDQYKTGNFHLEIGDVVDYAYWNDEIISGKIIWVYPTDSSPELIKEHEVQFLTSNPLNGLNIGIIGLETDKENFKRAIEANGGQLCYLSANESVEVLSSEISKTNILIIFIDSVGHDAMFKIRNVSKDFEIPILYSKSVESDALIQLILEELEIK
ncbi:MAG: hypothetical protein SOR77_10065 [Peptoniphilus sp.]|uniref:hypothetical protein n=1 Tax=Peptoniphilus sp. TaxID=1971214 RepID=UPI002A747A9C|nr:hypothetical protein [Peptoniphilus sp.]MDY2987964.1 hypothetical protein [Peptoniphilus sp.]